MKSILKVLFLVVVISLTACQQNNTNVINRYCSKTNFQADAANYILKTQSQPQLALFILHNKSKQVIWVNKVISQKNLGASAGWASKLAPGNWSALVLQQTNFHLACSTLQKNRMRVQNCTKTVMVCYVPKVDYQTKPDGGFWLAENLTVNKLLTALKKRGVTIVN